MTDTPTPPAMTPEQRARLIAKLQNQAEDIGIKHGRVEAAACMEAEAAEYLEADGVTIATLTAECDAAQTDLGIIIMSLPHGQNMRINGPVIGVKMLRKKYDAAQAEIARLTAALANAGGALDNIAELNMSGRDENGHRWANSDLIDQEIVWARIAITKGSAT